MNSLWLRTYERRLKTDCGRSPLIGLDLEPSSAPSRRSSFDHAVGAKQDRPRDRDPKRFRGLHVDHQLELGRPIDRQIPGCRALQDLVHEAGGAPEQVDTVWPISHKTSS